VTKRARKLIDGCRFQYYADIDAGTVLAYLTELRADTGARKGISARTFYFYLQAFKQFCRWMVRHQRAGTNPVGHLEPLNVKTDRRRERRALTVDELRTLLTATSTGPVRHRGDSGRLPGAQMDCRPGTG
jgi:site-specific recombinase XerC